MDKERILNFSGPSLQWATDLHRMWTTEFDWYAAQEQINQWPHFVAAVEDLDVHFVHARAKSDKAIPILLVHGWPGSIHEFSRVITPLSQPSSASDPAFHVVVPSLPGFAWSSWPPKAGWTLQDTARILDKLMKKLGHETYVVQCGDWGHFIGRELGTKYTDSCRAVHFNFAPSPLPEGIELTERERKVQERVDDWLQNHIGYAVCMRTRVSWLPALVMRPSG